MLTLPSEVEQRREFLPVRHLRSLLSELVKERMAHRLHSTQTRLGRVLEELRDQVDRFGSSAWPEDLGDIP